MIPKKYCQKKTGLKIDKSGSIIGEDKLKEIESYITDRTGKVKQPMLSSGFAGAQNPLFFKENTRMLFGDAKDSIGGLVSEFKD